MFLACSQILFQLAGFSSLRNSTAILYSFTEQWLSRQNDIHPSRRVADFLLLMRGMFPEKLERQGAIAFYETTGAGLYWRLQRTEMGAFRRRDGMLAENFPSYADAIKYARDNDFSVKRQGDWVKVLPYRASLSMRDEPSVLH